MRALIIGTSKVEAEVSDDSQEVMAALGTTHGGQSAWKRDAKTASDGQIRARMEPGANVDVCPCSGRPSGR